MLAHLTDDAKGDVALACLPHGNVGVMRCGLNAGGEILEDMNEVGHAQCAVVERMDHVAVVVGIDVSNQFQRVSVADRDGDG